MKKGTILEGIVIVTVALAFLAGCSTKGPQIQIPPKWQGAAYHLSFGAPPTKPNSAGLTIPPVKWDANPDMLETRADLVVKIDTSTLKTKGTMMDEMALGAVDISGAQGQLPATYMDEASTNLSKLLQAYCVKGKVGLSVALTRSSLEMDPTDDQINDKRLSDWTPIQLDFKNPHPKC
ncbi:MAG: hypothetical protein WAL45_17575 [Terracidiphilus sp.]